LSRYRVEGDVAVIHRSRGRESNRKIKEEKKREVVAILRDKYSDYGATLASEILEERHGIRISRETLRGWLCEAGLYEIKKRRVKHRRWRERRQCFGELLQVDTSEHDWLEGRGEKIYLISMIDDATSRLFARFYDSDSTVNNMDLLKRYLKRHGRPVSLYTDKASHFRYNGEVDLEHQLSGEVVKTQIGRALDELGIELIFAHSPQAKGRVERQFGTLRDRLVKRLLAGGHFSFGGCPGPGRPVANLRQRELYADCLFQQRQFLSGKAADSIFQSLFVHCGQLVGHGFARSAIYSNKGFYRKNPAGIATRGHNLYTLGILVAQIIAHDDRRAGFLYF
jgi:transposase InsO family protein